MITNQNPPAFPCDWKDFQPTTGEQVVREQFSGMDLRDYFASDAMSGFIMRGECGAGYAERVARMAYNIADAMLAERAKVKP